MLVYVAEGNPHVADVRVRPPASPVMSNSAQVCWHCESQPDRGGRWALIDPSTDAQVTEDQVQPRRLQLVVVPPTVRAGVGLIQLRWGATIYGQVELSLCPIDRRGLLLGLYVEPRHRRRDAGRVLVHAASERGAGFNWSANPPDEPGAAAFWTRIENHELPPARVHTRKRQGCRSNPAGRSGRDQVTSDVSARRTE
jgi:GNAT superfamily N-acetyltransferase